MTTHNKKTEIDYIKAAENTGFSWIGNFPNSVLNKTKWKCLKGHEWEASFANITHRTNPTGCPYCSKKAANKKEDYMQAALSAKLEWIGTYLPKSLEKTQWKCNVCGYAWESCIGHIRNRKCCPSCSKRARLTEASFNELAASKNIKWMGVKKTTANQKTLWKCSFGHEWYASYSTIKNSSSSGCRICFNNRIGNQIRISENRYYELAEVKKFKLVKVANKTVDNCIWECHKGHQWNASYHNVKNGTGCPICVNIVNGTYVSKPQYAIYAMVGGILNYKLLKYSIDIGIPENSIAIEYDSWYWHGNRVELDKKKTRDILQVGWKLIRIKSDTQIPDGKILKNTINQLISGKNYQEIILPDWGIGNVNKH